MLYKLTEGRLIPFTDTFVRIGDKIYTNPTIEQQKKAGWKPLIRSDPPKPRQGIYTEPVYHETDTQILESWNEVEIPTIIEEKSL